MSEIFPNKLTTKTKNRLVLLLYRVFGVDGPSPLVLALAD
jgi:hypothetical protein